MLLNRLQIGETDFLLDGNPFQIVSGAMHYWRVVPEHWADRIAWAKYLGLNTIETYVPWNQHEPEPGQVSFAGRLDLRRYLETIAEAGLHAIVRPGPYICAETDFGGLPPWLLREPGLRVRTADPAYLRHVDAWFQRLFPRLADLQSSRGGPIIAMQVENELGNTGPQPEYLDWLVAKYAELGVTVPLYTSDGHTDVAAGKHPALLMTANFGRDPKRAWEALAALQQSGPRMCAEYWLGWYDHWGERHHVRDPQETAEILDEILSTGASLNLYLFHGGTNFGFSNGANALPDQPYQSDITSYDYDAPLSEGGRPTAKFEAFRKVIARHNGPASVPAPPVSPLVAPQRIRLTKTIGLLDSLPELSQPAPAVSPVTMELLGQNYGFICYRFTAHERGTFRLDVPGVRDRGQVLVNGIEYGVLDREHEVTSMMLRIPDPESQVDILVENQGRVNFGPDLIDPKGIVGDIVFDYQPVCELTIYPLPLDNIDELDFESAEQIVGAEMDYPALCAGWFDIDKPGDGYLELAGWTKGVVWINGFNLGRFWNRGPQRRLYLPGPLLRAGRNELRVLELHGFHVPAVRLTDSPDLGT